MASSSSTARRLALVALLACAAAATANAAAASAVPQPAAQGGSDIIHATGRIQHSRTMPFPTMPGGARVSSMAAARIAAVPPALPGMPLADGDLVSMGFVLAGPTVVGNLYIINGTSLAVKAVLPDVCDTGANSVDVSPDKRQLAVPCVNGTVVFLNIANTSNVAVAGTVPLPDGFVSYQAIYGRSGNLLVSTQPTNLTTGVKTVFELPAPGADNTTVLSYPNANGAPGYGGMDLTPSCSTLLSTYDAPDVAAFNLSANASEPVFASVPGASCTDVLALYDGSALLGCYTNASNCIYHVAAGNTSNIMQQWYSATNDTGAVFLALAEDRQHIFVSVLSSDNFNSGAALKPTLFKLSLATFQVVANASLAPYLSFPVVYGAASACQQDCPVGFGQCCSTAGLPLPAGTVCNASTNVCRKDAVCDGASIACPKMKHVRNGTPCRQSRPAGLFTAVEVASSAFTPVEAASKGYHKCHARCTHGQCVSLSVDDSKKQGSYGKKHKQGGSKHHHHGDRTYEAAEAKTEVSGKEEYEEKTFFYCN